MIPAVEPVVKEIFCQQQEQPVRKDIGDGDPVMTIAKLEDDQVDATEEQVDAAVEQHQVNIGNSILPGISLAVAIVGKEDFQTDDNQVDRGADQYKYLFPEVFHVLKLIQITHLCSRLLLTTSKSLYMSDLLNNWEKKSKDRQKIYKQFLEKAQRPAVRNVVLDKLPELHEEAFQRIDGL